MYEILNELLEIVYIVDIDTYDLLFINQAGKKSFQLTSPEGEKCYKVLHHEDKPCSFCNCETLHGNSFERWEHVNRVIGQNYLLKDKKIKWNGRSLKVGIAMHVTDSVEQKKQLEHMVHAEEMIIECIRRLHSSSQIFQMLDEIFEMAGDFFRAECAWLFTSHERTVCNSNLWIQPGMEQWNDLMETEHVPSVENWDEIFGGHPYLAVADSGECARKHPQLYRALKGKELKNSILVSLHLPEGCSGCIGIHNFPPEEMDMNISLLCTLADFISSRLTLYKEQKRLEQLSYMDELTGVMNRNAFVRDQKKYETEKTEACGVICLDVNDMKGMNEKHGHEYGDQILADVARKVMSCFGSREVYRIGGDEFVVLSPASEEEFAGKCRCLSDKINRETNYKISIGYQWSSRTEDMTAILERADEMRDEDKKHYYRNSPIHRRYRHRLDDVLGLTAPGALKKMIEAGQFQVYLQPKYDVQNECVTGAEALIRHRLSSGCIVSPDQFIPILEQSHLIKKIDFWVFDQMCKKMREWKENGKETVPVSVNFSRNTMSDHLFLSELEAIWRQYELEPGLFEIEITENSCGNDKDSLREMIQKMKKLGFKISIDDFGVKDANLSLFTSVDFDVLKIDRSLVKDITENKKAQAVIQSIADLCRKMGIQMVVEGIETREQLETVRMLNCNCVQGFLFARPMPVNEFENKMFLETA